MSKELNSGMLNSYKGYIGSKRIYLKRKKELNRRIKYLKKQENKYKGRFQKGWCRVKRSKAIDDIDILNIMYRYEKHLSKRKK